MAASVLAGCRSGGPRPPAPGEPGAELWKGPVEGVRWSKPEALADGELHEYPDVVVDGAGDLWLAWVGFPDGKEHIYLQHKPRKGEADPPVMRLGEGQGATGWPRLAADGRRVYLTWAEQRNGRFEVRLASFLRGRQVWIETVSTAGFEAVRPVVAVDRAMVPWVAWEERRSGHFAVVARRMDGRSEPEVIDDSGELNLRPALTRGPGRTMVVAWDHYEEGRYDIRARRLGGLKLEPTLLLTDDRYLDQAPALFTDTRDRVWIAWHTDNPNPLGGSGGEVPPRPGRALVAAMLEGDALRWPKAGTPPTPTALPDRPEFDDVLEFPQLAEDRAGRLYLFARRGQGYLATYLEGDRWSAPIDLSDPGWGGRGRDLRVARDRDGSFHLAARWLHRAGHSLLLPPAGKAPPVALLEPRVLKTARAQERGEEPMDAAVEPPGLDARGPVERGQEVPADSGKTAVRRRAASWEGAPFLGDIHTHTWLSDGTGDPDELFTRSRDQLGHDFVALTDHDVSNGNRLAPFEWAWEQMLTNFFNRPGEFATLLAYEWTSSPVARGGAGHRNVYFPGNQAPLYGVDLEAPTTMTLFDLLRSSGAITIPHHTSWTGTDWENADPALQPLVEVVSVHGNSEVPDGKPIVPRAGDGGTYAVDGMRQGLRFGFVGGSDGHGVPWHYGVSRQQDVWTTGLTGVYADALDRNLLLAAMRERRCYATSGPAIQVELEARGGRMGQEVAAEVPVPGQAALNLRVRVRGSAPLASVTLVRDGEPVLRLPMAAERLELEQLARISPEPGVHAWYLRVVQEDGAMAWSSPLCVRR